MTLLYCKTEENLKSLLSLFEHITWVLSIVGLIEYIWKGKYWTYHNLKIQSYIQSLLSCIVAQHCFLQSFVIRKTYTKEVNCIVCCPKRSLFFCCLKHRKLIYFFLNLAHPLSVYVRSILSGICRTEFLKRYKWQEFILKLMYTNERKLAIVTYIYIIDCSVQKLTWANLDRRTSFCW